MKNEIHARQDGKPGVVVIYSVYDYMKHTRRQKQISSPFVGRMVLLNMKERILLYFTDQIIILLLMLLCFCCVCIFVICVIAVNKTYKLCIVF